MIKPNPGFVTCHLREVKLKNCIVLPNSDNKITSYYEFVVIDGNDAYKKGTVIYPDPSKGYPSISKEGEERVFVIRNEDIMAFEV